MQKHTLLFLVLLTFVSAWSRDWQPDSLAGYVRTTVNQPDGRRCVVVRKTTPLSYGRAVLYVHGYNDYFFQAEEGDTFVDSCYDFYAVDLRGYGRALEPGERPYQAHSVSDYYADLDSAISIMQEAGAGPIALMGHSTGGLITSCYMNAAPRPAVRALILNSPFLSWNMSRFMQSVMVPLVSCIGKHHPGITISQGDNTVYGQSILSAYHGRWSHINVEWKTLHPRRVTLGWIHMIQNAQQQLRHNPERILVPILLMHSARSLNPKEWTPEASKADIVLNVKDISKYGRTLGPSVTELTVPDAMHDIFLSDRRVTSAVYQALFGWLDPIMDY